MYTDSRPIAYLMDTLPEDVLSAGDVDEQFSGSVLDLLLARGDLALSHSRTEIGAVGASPEVARKLQVQRDDVLLHFAAALNTASGRVVDYSFSYFLPGYFRFHVVRRVG
jgi:GntR family transcriptional regulator